MGGEVGRQHGAAGWAGAKPGQGRAAALEGPALAHNPPFRHTTASRAPVGPEHSDHCEPCCGAVRMAVVSANSLRCKPSPPLLAARTSAALWWGGGRRVGWPGRALRAGCPILANSSRAARAAYSGRIALLNQCHTLSRSCHGPSAAAPRSERTLSNPRARGSRSKVTQGVAARRGAGPTPQESPMLPGPCCAGPSRLCTSGPFIVYTRAKP